jgi:hypothetical protein
LKNLALLVGIPLSIASLAGGAIRGFGMSNLIGLGLGAAATVYGFGFLDSVLHPKNMLPAEIERLKRVEAVKYLQQPGNAEWVAEKTFGARPHLSDLQRDYRAEHVPDEFKRLYYLSHGYIMKLCSKAGLLHTSLPRIFGYSYTGASPDADMINSLNKGRDLERHATIIILANLLKQVEKHPNGGEDRAANLLKGLVQRATYHIQRQYLADPITFTTVLDIKSADLYRDYGILAYSIKDKSIGQHFRELASHFDSDNQEAQTQ